MRVIRPFILIRIGVFNFQRMGHFAADVGQRKAESEVNRSPKTFDFWYLPDDQQCSNSYWAQITRRWFRVHSLVRYLFFWNQNLPFGEAHSLNSSVTGHSRDVNGFLEKANLRLPSTADEESKARNWMAQFGWKNGDPFVCLLVRDAKYLSEQYPQYDWDYHSYRNSDIKTYIKGIDYLVSQGIYVFRMGKNMAQEVGYSHPKFIDYAFREDKSDFLDVWLFANCSLCITTASGPDMISDVFRRPILAINFLPLNGLWSWSKAIHYPKILKWISGGKTLSLSEYFDQCHSYTDDYARAGVEFVDLNNNQIYEAVRESWQSAVGVRPLTAKERHFHERFKTLLRSHSSFKHSHNFLHSDSRLAFSFLAEVGESFLN